MADSKNAGTDSKKSSKPIIAIAVVAMVVIVALVVIIVVLMNKMSQTTSRPQQSTRATVTTAETTVATEDNIEELLAELNEPEEPPFTCEMNTEWHFKDASQPSYDVYVANAVENTRTMYFELALEENLEILYSSPYIPVGMKVDEVTLNKDLEAGTYPAVVVYHMVDEEENEVGSVTITVTLYIEN